MYAISDVLIQIEGIEAEKDRVAFLKSLQPRYAVPIKAILKHMFDPKIEFALPEGAPPYESKDEEPQALFADIRKFYLYTKGGHPTLTQGKREVLFQQMLEAMPKGDAELVIAMKEKRSPYKGLTRQVARKAWPDLLA